jgi:hypothetical protein
MFSKLKKTRFFALLIAAVFCSAFVAQADEGGAIASGATAADLAALNKDLTSKIASLEGQLSKLENRLSGAEKAATEAKASSASVSSRPVAVEGGSFRVPTGDIEVSGHLDTSLNWNLGDPLGVDGGGAGNSTLRAFDQDANTFNLNNLQFNFSRSAPDDGGVGFNAVFMYGNDATTSDVAGFDGADEFAIQQAHLEIKVPVGSGLTVLAGKFATLQGAEVIENHLNWNSSRSLLFFNAIPFTHTGVRALYDLFDGQITTALGLVNGWDSAIDNNDVKDLEARVGWVPSDNFSTSLGFMVGSQQADDSDNQRGLLDWIANWTPFPDEYPLELMVNLDYGWEEDTTAPATRSPSEDGLSDWVGYALYAQYELYDWLTLAARWEQFWDDHGFRTGLDGVRLWGMTYTADIAFYENLLTRLEWRHDHADTDLAYDSATTNHQDTLGLSMIYSF